LKESSDGDTLMAAGIWFQIWGAAEEKARRPKSVFTLGTWRNEEGSWFHGWGDAYL